MQLLGIAMSGQILSGDAQQAKVIAEAHVAPGQERGHGREPSIFLCFVVIVVTLSVNQNSFHVVLVVLVKKTGTLTDNKKRNDEK